MITTWFPPIFIFFFIALFLLAIGETLLSLFWAPVYFRHGIPLLRRAYTVPGSLDLVAQIPRLEQNLRRTWWRPGVVFRALSPTEIAFRQAFGTRNPLQGIIRVEPARNLITVSGHLYNLYLFLPVVLIVFVMGNVTSLFSVLPFAIFALALVFGLAMQYRHYAQIAQIIQDTLGASPSSTNQAVTIGQPTYFPTTEEKFSYTGIASNPTKPTTGFSTAEVILLIVIATLGLAAAWLLFTLLA